MVNTAAEKSAASNTGTTIIDLGKRKRKLVKRLREGTGPLLEEVDECIEELKSSGAIAKDAEPIIVVVREKEKRRGMLPGLY